MHVGAPAQNRRVACRDGRAAPPKHRRRAHISASQGGRARTRRVPPSFFVRRHRPRPRRRPSDSPSLLAIRTFCSAPLLELDGGNARTLIAPLCGPCLALGGDAHEIVAFRRCLRCQTRQRSAMVATLYTALCGPFCSALTMARLDQRRVSRKTSRPASGAHYSLVCHLVPCQATLSMCLA